VPKVRLPATASNDDFSRLEELFDQALSLPQQDRETYLLDTCAGDTDLLARLRALLAAHEDEEQVSDLHRQTQKEENTFQGRRLGPYELESLLGRGGMGAVYLAHRADGQYESKVAIKVVDLPLATDAFYDRFKQERQILARLTHPHIARLLDGGVSEDGILFLVMEHVEGTRIDDYCRSHKMTADAKLRLFVAVCGAVQFAHQSLVIHRDLKPDNVLVSEDGAPHLLDFGTAKLMSSDGTADTRGLTREGFLSFTPAYASPEQVLGRSVTTSSDTYSLGVLLYQMLTERLPYELNDFTAEEMIRVICEQAISSPTSADRTFPDKDLEAILAKALRKEPEQRYQTADAFAADVQAYLDHLPVSARRGNLRYRARKFSRRHRLALSFTAALALTLLMGVFAVLRQTHAARVAEQNSEASAKDLSQLSDTLLTELDDAIKQLPGSTGAQQLLVARVLEHLDRMAQNPRSNSFTKVSLANAYVRLASLQASPYEQNIDDVPGALHSLEKATTILTTLAAATPSDATVLLALARAQDARGEILSFADDSAGAAKNLNDSVKTYEGLLKSPAASPALFFEAGSVIDTLGDVMGQDTGFADPEAALRDYRLAIDFDRRALAMNPDFKPSRRGLATMQMKIGNVELDEQPAVALIDFKAAMTMLDALPAVERSRLDLTRLRALLLRKQALSLSELGRYAEADSLFAQSTAIYTQIAAADPKDLRALRDLDRLLTNETFSVENEADPSLTVPAAAQQQESSSRQALARAEELEAQRAVTLEKLLQVSPGDVIPSQELAAVRVRLETLRLARRSPDDLTLRRDREALDTLRSAASKEAASTLVLDMAGHAFMDVRPTSLRDTAFALQCMERGTALTHRKVPSWLLSLAQAYRASGDPVRALASAREGLALLPQDNADRNFRLRRQLEYELKFSRKQ
jgi:serine/threonine protein kinase